MTFEDEMRGFLERMGYHNGTHDIETNQLSADFSAALLHLAHPIHVEQWANPEEPRLIRYRRSSNGTYQEVWLEPNGTTWYGMYMPEGYVPPPGMGE